MSLSDRVSNAAISPRQMRVALGWTVVLTAVLWGAATWLGWVQSVVFISHISMAALLIEVFLAWQNARVEVRQVDAEEG